MKDFAGRTAFVTGGANGVGIGLVRALLAQGCNVAIADIRPASIDAALRALDNPRAMGVEVDVSSRKDLARAAEAVEARFGVVSLLFNNAGVNLFQTVEESSYDDWDWLMGVNLHGPINGAMTFVPRMIRAGQGGYVVNTASMAAFLAAGVCGIYNTTKIAARVLEAMREDRFHIFTHPEFKDELSEVFGEIMQDFRDYPVDPGHGQRTDFEKTRRESYRKQRRGLKAR